MLYAAPTKIRQSANRKSIYLKYRQQDENSFLHDKIIYPLIILQKQDVLNLKMVSTIVYHVKVEYRLYHELKSKLHWKSRTEL